MTNTNETIKSALTSARARVDAREHFISEAGIADLLRVYDFLIRYNDALLIYRQARERAAADRDAPSAIVRDALRYGRVRGETGAAAVSDTSAAVDAFAVRQIPAHAAFQRLTAIGDEAYNVIRFILSDPNSKETACAYWESINARFVTANRTSVHARHFVDTWLVADRPLLEPEQRALREICQCAVSYNEETAGHAIRFWRETSGIDDNGYEYTRAEEIDAVATVSALPAFFLPLLRWRLVNEAAERFYEMALPPNLDITGTLE